MTNVIIFCFVFPGDRIPTEAEVRAAIQNVYPFSASIGDNYPVIIVEVDDVHQMNAILDGEDAFAIVVTPRADESSRLRTSHDPALTVG